MRKWISKTRKSGWYAPLVGVLFLISSSAAAGPPDEALGDVESNYPSGEPVGDRAIFNAFELGPVTADRCRGKGSLVYTVTRGSVTYVYYIDIKYVNAQPDKGEVWFSGICTDTTRNDQYDTTNVGLWFKVKGWDSTLYPDHGFLNGNWIAPSSDAEDQAEAFVCEEGGISVPGSNRSGFITVQVHAKGRR